MKFKTHAHVSDILTVCVACVFICSSGTSARTWRTELLGVKSRKMNSHVTAWPWDANLNGTNGCGWCCNLDVKPRILPLRVGL